MEKGTFLQVGHDASWVAGACICTQCVYRNQLF